MVRRFFNDIRSTTEITLGQLTWDNDVQRVKTIWNESRPIQASFTIQRLARQIWGPPQKQAAKGTIANKLDQEINGFSKASQMCYRYAKFLGTKLSTNQSIKPKSCNFDIWHFEVLMASQNGNPLPTADGISNSMCLL